jgi:hypothetical protein
MYHVDDTAVDEGPLQFLRESWMQGPLQGGRALLVFDSFPSFDLSRGFLIKYRKLF